MEHILLWAPRIASCLLLVMGIIGFFKPRAFTDATGIQLTNGTAMSEARSVFGGTTLGLGVAALAFDQPEVYACIGTALIGVLFARVYSMFVDDVPHKVTLSTIIIDGLIAVPLLVGFIASVNSI